MKKIRIMVFGTFDILHKGHINFFKQARKLAKKPYLIVSVARDINVKKIKGHKTINNEKYRLLKISKQRQVDREFNILCDSQMTIIGPYEDRKRGFLFKFKHAPGISDKVISYEDMMKIETSEQFFKFMGVGNGK